MKHVRTFCTNIQCKFGWYDPETKIFIYNLPSSDGYKHETQLNCSMNWFLSRNIVLTHFACKALYKRIPSAKPQIWIKSSRDRRKISAPEKLWNVFKCAVKRLFVNQFMVSSADDWRVKFIPKCYKKEKFVSNWVLHFKIITGLTDRVCGLFSRSIGLLEQDWVTDKFVGDAMEVSSPLTYDCDIIPFRMKLFRKPL